MAQSPANRLLACLRERCGATAQAVPGPPDSLCFGAMADRERTALRDALDELGTDHLSPAANTATGKPAGL